MVEDLKDFKKLVIAETLSVNGDKGVEVCDLGREGAPSTWVKFKKGRLFILGEDDDWHEIDVEYAMRFWQAKESERMYVNGVGR